MIVKAAVIVSRIGYRPEVKYSQGTKPHEILKLIDEVVKKFPNQCLTLVRVTDDGEIWADSASELMRIWNEIGMK